MGKPKKKKEFFVNPLKNKNIGWRSGKDLLAGKVIRVNEQGFENLEDYYSESDADFTQDLTVNVSRVTRNSKENKYNKSIAENPKTENETQNTRIESNQTRSLVSSQSSNMFAWLKNKNIGRRTGKDVLAGKVITKNRQGFDNIEDYFSESSDAESMFMSRSRISVGLDNTDVVERSYHRSSVSCVPSATTDDPAANDSEDSYLTDGRTPKANVTSPIPGSEGEEDTPTNKLHDSHVQAKLSGRKDQQTLSQQEVKDQSSENQDSSSDDEEVQFNLKSTEKTSEITGTSDQTEVTAGVEEMSEDTALTEKSEDTALTEKSEDTALTEKSTAFNTDELTTIPTEKSSKSYISNTINIGGNVTGSLTKSDDPSLDSTGPITSFKTRKKLSFSALEKSMMMKEIQKNRRSANKVAPVVNSNPFNKSVVKSTTSSIIEDVEDSSQLSVPESLDQPTDISVEDEFRIVSDDSVSKTTKTKQQSKGAVTGRERSRSQRRKSNKRQVSVSKEEAKTTEDESLASEKVQTAKSVGKHVSQIQAVISPKGGEDRIESNSQNTDRTLKRKSLKRKSDGDVFIPKNEQMAKSVEKQISRKKSMAATKSDEENIKNSQKCSRASKQKNLKRKSNALVPTKTTDNDTNDECNEGHEDLVVKQTEAKKQKSTSTKKRVVSQGNESRKVEYSYDSDDSSVIINEYENEIEKKMKSKRSKAIKSNKSNVKSGKRIKSEGDQNSELNRNNLKKRRTFVLGDYDSETSETPESSHMDGMKKKLPSKGDSNDRVSNISKVTDTGKVTTKGRRTNTVSLVKDQGETSQSMVLKNDGNISDNVFGDDSNKKEDVIKKPLKRIGRNSRKSCPESRSSPSHPPSVSGDNRSDKKEQQNSRKSCPGARSTSSLQPNKRDNISVGKPNRKNSTKSSTESRSSSTPIPNNRDTSIVGKTKRKNSTISHPESVPSPTPLDDEGSIMDPDKLQEHDEMLPAEDLTVNDLPGDNSPDDSIPEEQEEVQEARRPRRAVAAKSKPEKKTKGRLLLKQTLSKEKIKKGVAGKTNVLKTGKGEPKKATKAKGKIKEKQVVARKTRVSKSKVSEAKGKRGQKVSIGFVEEDSLVNTPRVLHNSPTASTTTAKTSVYINQKNNSHLDVSEEQVVDNLDVDVNVSAVKSSRKDKLPARDSSSSNRKPNKQKGGKGSKGASNKESFRDDEKEVSAVVDSDPVPVNDDMPMLSHSNLRRSQLARTMQSPQGSCTPFSATPGSEFTLTRREEMLRSGVSFRHQKMAQSGKKSTSRNSSRTSGKGDTEVCSENDFDAGHDKDDKVDYEDDDGGGGDDVDDDDSDDDGNDLPQDMMDDVSLDVQESSVGQQNTSTKGQLSGTKSRLSLASAVVSKSCPSPANLTPCLVTPGRKSLSKGRRVTISHQVTEAVYDVPSDLSSSDSPVSSKTSQRSSIPGGDMTTYISMSSTPIHVCKIYTMILYTGGDMMTYISMSSTPIHVCKIYTMILYTGGDMTTYISTLSTPIHVCKIYTDSVHRWGHDDIHLHVVHTYTCV
ncbi:nucleoprotein TPR-like isoform X2 [Pecten maximus]|uniref:nucleoprotein TPR-like isoform X2 n=1 Tax=Pecten maximus TaxID=6579 RepID=UPI001458AE47|nr:nucleoprotein TPR-like isoform X2 [Pecten maximus]